MMIEKEINMRMSKGNEVNFEVTHKFAWNTFYEHSENFCAFWSKRDIQGIPMSSLCLPVPSV